MHLDRNVNLDGKGKYALLNLRRWPGSSPALQQAFQALVEAGAIDFGDTPETEFFVIKLKDAHASAALHAYAQSVRHNDAEFAADIMGLVQKAWDHPNKKQPD